MAEEDFRDYIRRQEEARQKAQQQYRQPIQPQQFRQPQYQPPRQPYYQQTQQPYPRPKQPIPQGSHSKFLILLLLFILLIGVVLTLFFVFGGEEPQEVPVTPITPVTEEEAPITGTITLEELGVTEEELEPTIGLTITQIKFASNVRDDLSYDEVTDATFAKNEQPWIVFEVNNLRSGNVGTEYQTSYDEYIVVIGPDGRTIEELTGFLGTSTDPAELGNLYDFPIAHQLLTDENYATGEYEITIFIDDLINGVEASQTGVFTLR